MTAPAPVLGMEPRMGQARPGETIQFVVPGAPVPTARAGRRFNPKTGRVHSFTPKRTASFQNLVRLAFVAAYPGFTPIEGPIVMRASFFMPIPASARKALRVAAMADENAVPHAKKPDGKNLRWGIEDALEGLAFRNDSQVYAWHDCKTYSSRPRTVVEIEAAR